MKYKNIIMTMLIIALSAAFITNAYGRTATEIAPSIRGHWAEGIVTFAYDRGYLDLTASFDPDAEITRGAFAVLLDIWIGVNRNLLTNHGFRYERKTVAYTDISPEMPDYRGLLNITGMGIMRGENRRFNPDEGITNQEAAMAWLNVLRLLRNSNMPDFISKIDAEAIIERYTDYEDIDKSAVTAVAVMTSLNFMAGYRAGNFLPERTITYAEALTIFSNVDVNLARGVTANDIFVPTGSERRAVNMPDSSQYIPVLTHHLEHWPDDDLWNWWNSP